MKRTRVCVYSDKDKDEEWKARDDLRKDRVKERQRDRNIARAAPDRRSDLRSGRWAPVTDISHHIVSIHYKMKVFRIRYAGFVLWLCFSVSGIACRRNESVTSLRRSLSTYRMRAADQMSFSSTRDSIIRPGYACTLVTMNISHKELLSNHQLLLRVSGCVSGNGQWIWGRRRRILQCVRQTMEEG